MTSSRAFAARVVAWQRTHGRHDLPWQNTRDAYRIWLSEIMLQQTQVTTVLPYYERFVAAFPDVAALAAAPLERVLEHWSGLGYYRRAHHLHAAARAVVAGHGGGFPHDAATIATLPGVGRSTAAAIAVFAHGERAAILDGNVKRVLARHAGVEGFPGAASVEARLWALAEARLPTQDVEPYTQGLMDLGATLCTRTKPRCGECPVAADCVARRDGRVDELPSPRPAKALPRKAVRVLLLERAGEVLLERRAPTGIWARAVEPARTRARRRRRRRVPRALRAGGGAGRRRRPRRGAAADRPRLHPLPADAPSAARARAAGRRRRARGRRPVARSRRRRRRRVAGADSRAAAQSRRLSAAPCFRRRQGCAGHVGTRGSAQAFGPRTFGATLVAQGDSRQSRRSGGSSVK